MRGVIILGLTLAWIISSFYFQSNSNPWEGPVVIDLTEPELVLIEAKLEPIPQFKNENYNITNIVNNIKNISCARFVNISCDSFNLIADKDSDWEYSYYSDIYKEIFIGMGRIENNPDQFEFIFTHEYMHFLLHEIGVESRTTQEAWAEAWAWSVNEKEGKKLWGENGEERGWMYGIIIQPLAKENKISCLDKVFRDISEFSDLENNLLRQCNLNWTEISEYEGIIN